MCSPQMLDNGRSLHQTERKPLALEPTPCAVRRLVFLENSISRKSRKSHAITAAEAQSATIIRPPSELPAFASCGPNGWHRCCSHSCRLCGRAAAQPFTHLSWARQWSALASQLPNHDSSFVEPALIWRHLVTPVHFLVILSPCGARPLDNLRVFMCMYVILYRH